MIPTTRLRLAEVRKVLPDSWRLVVAKWTRMEMTWPRVTMMNPDSVEVPSRLGIFLVLLDRLVLVMYFKPEGWMFV